jgi:hypothetical protein
MTPEQLIAALNESARSFKDAPFRSVRDAGERAFHDADEKLKARDIAFYQDGEKWKLGSAPEVKSEP